MQSGVPLEVLAASEKRAESVGLSCRVKLVAADYHSIELASQAFDESRLEADLPEHPDHAVIDRFVIHAYEQTWSRSS